jgi:hypothetical protein
VSEQSNSYNHQTVALDGRAFTGCEFTACRLVYSGGEPPRFVDCRFDACEWKFEGAAADTLSHLKAMWSLGAKAAVQAIIKDVTVVGR